jgi:N-acetylglutamate synthase-like GNAT family acetyltransferase
MIYRHAKFSDLEAIGAILDKNNLPSEDCRDHIDHFIVLEINGQLSGIGGLEHHGHYGLLRSIVINTDVRNRGLGKKITQKIIDQARDDGIKTLYLLTEGAAEYFAALGFTTVKRTDVPLPIRQSRQFSSLCPTTAIVMGMDIDH